MAKTNSGIEFYLVEVTAAPDRIERIEEVLRKVVRRGDGVFALEGRLYLAFAADVRGSGNATRRMLHVLREQGLEAKTRLVQEPFTEDLWDAAARIVVGEVAVTPRLEERTDAWDLEERPSREVN